MSTTWSVIIRVVAALAVIVPAVRLVWQYEKGVVFRFGKLRGERGPGLNFILPYIDRMIKIDMRVETLVVDPQDVGRSLAATGDPVYAPIGQLLADWLVEMSRPLRHRVKTGSRLPVIARPEACTLCSFCAQICPTQALVIRETDVETGLVLTPSACVGCNKCEEVCNFGALHKEARPSNLADPIMLRVSPRAICPGCGKPTVSRAELDAVAASLGQKPPWLDHCLECRSMLMELA